MRPTPDLLRAYVSPPKPAVGGRNGDGARRGRYAARNIGSLVMLFALLLSALPINALPAAAAITPSTGTMIANRATLPRGAVFLNDGNGGHWWVSDQVLGICELMPQAGPPPFTEINCNGTAKSGGQITVGDPAPSLGLPAGSKLVYVADASSKSIHVVRFVFSPAGNGSFTNNTQMNVNNPTFVGGGSGGGRVVALALAPHNGPAANGGSQDLYVGYLKSGDVMRIDGVDAIALTNQNPSVARVGSTSDGKGVNAFVMFGNDLYLAELGGFGMSRIKDPSGITRPACSAASVCTAVMLNPQPDFAPGGLATDWSGGPTTGKFIFIGDAQLGVTANAVLRYDPAAGAAEIYSQSISPSYVSGTTTYTQYVGVLGLGFNPATSELYAGDDPQFSAATPVLQQGHIWKILPAPPTPTVTGINPTSGIASGGTAVTITGTNFSTTPGQTTVNFGANPATLVSCVSATQCTATSPAGLATVDVIVSVNGQPSATSAADQFTYTTANPNAIVVQSVAPNTGATIGGTTVTITGQNLAVYDLNTGLVIAPPAVNFGPAAATNVACPAVAAPAAGTQLTPPINGTCTATSPAGSAGTVDVLVSDAAGTSMANPPADSFTYVTPVANFYAWGITAPKGGAVWLPGALGGHWWSSDHAQGLCRQDPVPTGGQFGIAGNTLHAINFAVCGADLVGSAGQAVYDSRPVALADPTTGLPTGTQFPNLHYVYVPDNAVKSTAVWRLTFDANTETMVSDPNGGALATAMTPLADVRTLKPNGMALGPDGNLYITDLVEPNVRKLTHPDGDPRIQTITIVAVTGDNRGANGTQGFIGNLLYISGNRATQFFDITQCPLAAGPCGMASVPAPQGIFVAGSMTDAANKLVYISASPGAANATIYRYNAGKDAYVAFLAGSVAADAFGVVTCPGCTLGSQALAYITGGNLPGPQTPNGTVACALTCQRPWDQTNHPTTSTTAPVATSFAFAFGLGVDPGGNLVITEDPSAGARSGRGTMWFVPFIP